MEFRDPTREKSKLVDLFSREEDISADKIRFIASPYRICPLGAHVDHQGGPVLGMTINAYTLMAFAAADDGTTKLRSHNYPGRVIFDVNRVPE